MTPGLVLPAAAALGGHLVHVVVFGGALALALAVYAIAAVTAPRTGSGRVDENRVQPTRSSPAVMATAGGRDGPPSPRGSHRTSPAATARQLAFIGLCAAAATHLAVMPSHFRQSWMYGTFFAVLAPIQLLLAVLVLARARSTDITAALAFSLGVVVLWAFTRYIGVPLGPDNGGAEPIGVLDAFATAAELLAAGALLHLRLSGGGVACGSAPAWRWSGWPVLMRGLLVTAVVVVPLVCALAPSS